MLKQFVRVICAVLCPVIALAMFAGCKKPDKVPVSSETAGASSNTTSYENTEIIDQYEKDSHIPETADLGGFEMKIATSRTKMIIPDPEESADNEIIVNAVREIQDAYNCTISVIEVANNNWNPVLAEILAGEEYANVIMPGVVHSGNFVQSRLCADFLQSSIAQYIDMSEPWWNDTMAYASNVEGSVYAGAPCINSPADATHVVFFNKKIAAEAGIGENELYELWDDMKWTWDAFVKYAKKGNKDLDGSGAVDSVNDRWGFVAPGYDAGQAFCSSARVASVTTENGMNPTYTFNTAHAISTLTRLNKLYTTDGIYCQESWTIDSTDTKWWFTKMFTQGRALFCVYAMDFMRSSAMRDMEDEWGLLTLPLGPSDTSSTGWQEKYMSRVDHNFFLTIIPANVTEMDSTALVLEAMAFKFWKIINEKVETYATLYCSDDRSIDISKVVYNTSTFEISQFLYSINNSQWAKDIEFKLNDVVKVPNYDVSGNVNAVEAEAQTMIDTYFAGE